MEKVTSSDGTTIAYERQGSGEPILLVHGTTGDTTGWALVTPLLADRFEVIAMDRRGSGESGEGNDPHSLDLEADDVAAVIEAVGAPVHLVGHSMGARVSLHAATRGVPLRSLTLYEPPIALDDTHIAVADRADELIANGDRGAAAEHFLTLGAAASPQEVQILSSIPEVWARVTGNAHLAPRDIRTLHASPVDLEAAKGIDVPTLVIVGGDQGADVYLNGLEDIERAIGDTRRAVIPGQRHFANAFTPDAFADAVASFVGSVAPEGARS